MAAALKLMRDKGLIGDKALEYTGRNKDKLLHNEMNKFSD